MCFTLTYILKIPQNNDVRVCDAKCASFWTVCSQRVPKGQRATAQGARYEIIIIKKIMMIN